jgi:hypothetical protein
MPNLDSTGKFGRSMDCSQLLEFKKKYKTVQQQNGKTPQGDQKQKPAFNSNRLGGGGSENGASWYYNQKGNFLIFDRFFGSRSLGTTQSRIDPRVRELAELTNRVLTLSGAGYNITSFVITRLTSTELDAITTLSDGRSTSGTGPLTSVIPNPLPDSEIFYLNNTGSPITITTSDGTQRTYSAGQIFRNDKFGNI